MALRRSPRLRRLPSDDRVVARVRDPNLTRTAMARTSEHDAYFVLTSGSHRTTECTACHTDAQRTKLVRCDGCHQDLALRRQHATAIARSASACLRCHPRGAAR